jgi:hypothetical protein
MNGAWIAVALLAAFGVFEWAENHANIANSTGASQTQNPLNAALGTLAAALAKAGSGGGSGAGSSGGGSGSTGSGASAFSPSSSGSPLSSEFPNQYVNPGNDPDQSTLISSEAGPGDFQVAPVDYDPTDTDSAVDDGTSDYDDFDDDSDFDDDGFGD